MPPGRLPVPLRGDPEEDYVTQLAWECLGIQNTGPLLTVSEDADVHCLGQHAFSMTPLTDWATLS